MDALDESDFKITNPSPGGMNGFNDPITENDDDDELIFSDDQSSMLNFNLTSTHVGLNKGLTPFSQSVKGVSPKKPL
jgi:hypothetical protein